MNNLTLNEHYIIRARECGIPPHMIPGLLEYLIDGVPPGSFLRAILENNFVHAAIRAEHINQHALFNYAHFLYAHAPVSAWGSPTIVRDWMAERHVITNSQETPE